MNTAHFALAAAATVLADKMTSIRTRVRYEIARAQANALSSHLPDELPRVQITTGRPGKQPRYAYSEEEIEAVWGQFRDWSPGRIRDALERGYLNRMAEFRAKAERYEQLCNALGLSAADEATACLDYARNQYT